MRQMATRMESTEMRQQQIMAFLARAVHNPAFLQQLLSARQNQRTLDNQGTPQALCFTCMLQARATLTPMGAWPMLTST